MISFLVIYLHCYACIMWYTVKDAKQWTPYYLQEEVENSITFLYYDESVTTFSKYLVCLY